MEEGNSKMKNGMDSLQAFAAEIERRSKAKEDLVASTAKCELVPLQGGGVGMVVGDDKKYGINKVGHDQIAETVDIPTKYYHRMLRDQPGMLANDVNTWFKANPQKRLIRTLDNQVRAVRSDSFRTDLEYEDLAAGVLPVLMKLDVAIMSYQLTDTRMYIKVVDKEVERKLAAVGGKFGDGAHNIVRCLSPAITISDSEVGHGSASVLAGVYDSFCSNLATFGERSVRKYHMGTRHSIAAGTDYSVLSEDTRKKTTVATIAQIRDVVEAAFDRKKFGDLCDRIAETAEEKIAREADLVEVVKLTGRKVGYTEEEGKGILRHLADGGDLSRFGLYNAVTRYSQDVEDYDRATEFERIGAKVIELPKKDWKVLSEAA